MGLKSFLAQASLPLLLQLLLPAVAQESPFVPPTKGFIVEFAEGSARKADGSTDAESFFRKLADAGADATPGFTYDSDIFRGASFQLSNDNDQLVDALANLPEIQHIWPEQYYTLDDELANVKVLDAVEAEQALTAWSPHTLTNASAVHALGQKGKGVVVAVIDTGIDWRHPALGGAIGTGLKVEGGWNVFDNNDNIMDCQGHGTHVAGIIAAGADFRPGVAPEATLRGYKVFGCSDGAPESVVVAAVLRAYEDGVDIMNLSLGNDRGFPTSPVAIALTRIRRNGVIVVTAQGNSGHQGPFRVTDASTAFDTISVGSTEHDELAGFEVTAISSSGENRTFSYVTSDFKRFNISSPIPAAYFPNTPRTVNICTQLRQAAYPDFSVVVIPRGNCQTQSIDNVFNDKADWIFVMNFRDADMYTPKRIMYNPAIQPLGHANIAYEDGDWLIRQRENNQTVSFIFSQSDIPVAVSMKGQAGGRLNEFSSWGPTVDGRQKPEISAPGGNIYSTWTNSQWSVISGTSMAAPYIAGVSALIISSRGGRANMGPDAAEYVRNRIAASGKPIRHALDENNLAATSQQGAGIVDAYKAVEYATSLSPTTLSLGDSEFQNKTREITITNSGTEALTYKLSHEVADTQFTRNPENLRVVVQPRYTRDSGQVAEVSFSSNEVTVGAGQTGTFTVSFTEPAAADAVGLPVYSGALIATANNGESVRVTYMGIKGSLYSFVHFDPAATRFLAPNGQPMVDGATYDFATSNGNNVPSVPFVIQWSTEEWSIDFVDRNWTPADWAHPTVAGQNNFHGSMSTASGRDDDAADANFPIFNYLRLLQPFVARPRNVFSTAQGGGPIPSGEYRYLIRSLRTFGDRKNINDWEWKLSPWFRVQRT